MNETKRTNDGNETSDRNQASHGRKVQEDHESSAMAGRNENRLARALHPSIHPSIHPEQPSPQ